MACVVVTIGSRATEASILTVAILRELGVPRIVARAFDERHARLLLAIGANEVLNPEDEMGERLALHVARPGILDRFRCAGGWVAEVEAPEAFAGSALGDLDLAGDVEVLAVRRGDRVEARPAADWRIESGDVLIVLGGEDAIHRIEALR
jgi:trk system potassium uptake protein TrkA